MNLLTRRFFSLISFRTMAFNNLSYTGDDYYLDAIDLKTLPRTNLHNPTDDSGNPGERPVSCPPPAATQTNSSETYNSLSKQLRSSFHRYTLPVYRHRFSPSICSREQPERNFEATSTRHRHPQTISIDTDSVQTIAHNTKDIETCSVLPLAFQRESSAASADAAEAVSHEILPTKVDFVVNSANAEEKPQQVTVEFSRRLIISMLALLCSTNLCLAMGASLIAPFFPEQAIRKGGTATLAGVVMSSFDAVRFFLAPVVGQYITQIGARFMLIAGPLIVAWCSVLFGVLGAAPAGPWFFILGIATRMVAGGGAIAYSVTSVSIRPVLFSGNVSFAYGALRASSTLGVIIGPAIGGLLYALGGYGLPFWVLGSLSLTLTFIQAFVTPDLSEVVSSKKHEISDEKETNTADTSATIEHRKASTAPDDKQPTPKKPTVYAFAKNIHILLCFIMNASIGYVVMFYSANIALHILPLVNNDVSKVGFIILISGIAEVIVAPLAGWMLDRGLSAEFSITLSYTLCAVGLLLLGPSPLLPFFSKSIYLVVIGTFVYGCGIGFGFSAPYKLATHQAVLNGYPANQQTYGVLAGCMVTFYTFGAFLGPITGGLLHDSVGFPWAATIVCGYLLLMVLISSGRSCWYRIAT